MGKGVAPVIIVLVIITLTGLILFSSTNVKYGPGGTEKSDGRSRFGGIEPLNCFFVNLPDDGSEVLLSHNVIQRPRARMEGGEITEVFDVKINGMDLFEGERKFRFPISNRMGDKEVEGNKEVLIAPVHNLIAASENDEENSGWQDSQENLIEAKMRSTDGRTCDVVAKFVAVHEDLLEEENIIDENSPEFFDVVNDRKSKSGEVEKLDKSKVNENEIATDQNFVNLFDSNPEIDETGPQSQEFFEQLAIPCKVNFVGIVPYFDESITGNIPAINKAQIYQFDVKEQGDDFLSEAMSAHYKWNDDISDWKIDFTGNVLLDYLAPVSSNWNNGMASIIEQDVNGQEVYWGTGMYFGTAPRIFPRLEPGTGIRRTTPLQDDEGIAQYNLHITLSEFRDNYFEAKKEQNPGKIPVIVVDTDLNRDGNSLVGDFIYDRDFGVIVMMLNKEAFIQNFHFIEFNQYRGPSDYKLLFLSGLGRLFRFAENENVNNIFSYFGRSDHHPSEVSYPQSCKIRYMCHNSDLIIGTGTGYGVNPIDFDFEEFYESVEEQHSCGNIYFNGYEECEVEFQGINSPFHVNCDYGNPTGEVENIGGELTPVFDFSRTNENEIWGDLETPFWCYQVLAYENYNYDLEPNPYGGISEQNVCQVTYFCDDGEIVEGTGEECESGVDGLWGTQDDIGQCAANQRCGGDILIEGEVWKQHCKCVDCPEPMEWNSWHQECRCEDGHEWAIIDEDEITGEVEYDCVECEELGKTWDPDLERCDCPYGEIWDPNFQTCVESYCGDGEVQRPNGNGMVEECDNVANCNNQCECAEGYGGVPGENECRILGGTCNEFCGIGTSACENYNDLVFSGFKIRKGPGEDLVIGTQDDHFASYSGIIHMSAGCDPLHLRSDNPPGGGITLDEVIEITNQINFPEGEDFSELGLDLSQGQEAGIQVCNDDFHTIYLTLRFFGNQDHLVVDFEAPIFEEDLCVPSGYEFTMQSYHGDPDNRVIDPGTWNLIQVPYPYEE